MSRSSVAVLRTAALVALGLLSGCAEVVPAPEPGAISYKEMASLEDGTEVAIEYARIDLSEAKSQGLRMAKDSLTALCTDAKCSQTPGYYRVSLVLTEWSGKYLKGYQCSIDVEGSEVKREPDVIQYGFFTCDVTGQVHWDTPEVIVLPNRPSR